MKFAQKLLAEIEKRVAQQSAPFCVAIDGRCASGKSSLGKWLAEKLFAPVLHTDDFYLPFNQRTPQRMQQVGGHIDVKRLREEVLEPLSQGKEFLYRPYCPHQDIYRPSQKFSPQKICILEGSYCLLPELEKFYQYKIFLTLSPQVQQKRLLKREGKEKLQMFLSRWILWEENYFQQCRAQERADWVEDTSLYW